MAACCVHGVLLGTCDEVTVMKRVVLLSQCEIFNIIMRCFRIPIVYYKTMLANNSWLINLQNAAMVISTHLCLYVSYSSYRVSRSWITVCCWASTAWTRPVELESAVGATQGTVVGQKEQWPQISAGHKHRKVCIAQRWSPFRGRLAGRELWIPKTSEFFRTPSWILEHI